MSPWFVLGMGLAGGLGAVARFVADSLVRARTRTPFPVGTTLVNLSGSLLLGLVTGIAASGSGGGIAPVVGTGFCGGFTTFSTASVEAVGLLRARRPRLAWAAVCLNALGCVALAWAGCLITGRWPG